MHFGRTQNAKRFLGKKFMMQKTKAIVIKSNDRKEKDKNILLFSLENGKMWATLKGVKGANAKMKIAQNLFCFGEFVLEDGKFGKIVTGFESIETFYEISEDVDKYFVGTALLEILNAVEVSSESENTHLFVLTLKALKNLCFSEINPLYILDKFLISVFEISGNPFCVEKCNCCGSNAFDKLFVDYTTGEIVCINCKGYACEELSKTTLIALKLLINLDFDDLKTLKLANGSEIGLLRILVRVFETKFDKRLKFVGILS